MNNNIIKMKFRNRMIIDYLMNPNQFNLKVLNKVYRLTIKKITNHNQMIESTLDKN